jgi:hypothetical protein
LRPLEANTKANGDATDPQDLIEDQEGQQTEM